MTQPSTLNLDSDERLSDTLKILIAKAHQRLSRRHIKGYPGHNPGPRMATGRRASILSLYLARRTCRVSSI